MHKIIIFLTSLLDFEKVYIVGAILFFLDHLSLLHFSSLLILLMAFLLHFSSLLRLLKLFPACLLSLMFDLFFRIFDTLSINQSFS